MAVIDSIVERCFNRKILEHCRPNVSSCVLPVLAFISLAGTDGILRGLEAVAKRLPSNRFLNHAVSCEKDLKMRQWIANTSSVPALYEDIMRIVTDDGRAVNHRSSEVERVLTTEIIYAGTSCKQFSMLCDPSKRVTSIAGTSTGQDNSSADTLTGLFDIKRVQKLKIVLLENVKNMNATDGDTGVSALQFVPAKLQSLGYVTGFALIASDRCGVPQSRKRYYYGGWRACHLRPDEFGQRCRAFQDALDEACERMQHEHRANSLDDFLVADGDELLKHYLLASKATTFGRMTDNWCADHHMFEMEMLTRTVTSAEAFPADEFSAVLQSVSTFPLREQDLLRLTGLEHGSALAELMIPLHSSLSRSEVYRQSCAPPLAPNTTLYHFKKRRVLLGIEHFMLQMGFDSAAELAEAFGIDACTYTDSFVRAAAGNAFCVPSGICFKLAFIESLSMTGCKFLFSET